ncbi:MAG: hypothetical protein Q9M91_03695 [Candidatus Dojkabacteria bacterium]|nr:hypothetical protein [Candidatus Dojkabacteria bacterium]MDQ7020919.1 hypothetical protein [Candidatus Dojkabacteria bacterium]
MNTSSKSALIFGIPLLIIFVFYIFSGSDSDDNLEDTISNDVDNFIEHETPEPEYVVNKNDLVNHSEVLDIDKTLN